ncbi:GntR family transcriptional regulator [Marinimicrobium agarilyticum]|uniref:GntR family transcriptional regulator n=1 Tax=Marinimicrobium agarilyticum TaxID=306546 RepID=UPI000411C9A9|nr:GntR family transcriptional regulator [Marinimicrobium agarilyticum]
MTDLWNDDQPIYRQLYERVVRLILRGDFAEGDALPSVRQLSADYRINHLTVAKSYQALVDEGLVEKRRGLGMFVLEGARERLLARERQLFLEKELPELIRRARELGIEPAVLQDAVTQQCKEKSE